MLTVIATLLISGVAIASVGIIACPGFYAIRRMKSRQESTIRENMTKSPRLITATASSRVNIQAGSVSIEE
jgi:purine-cytosine permease-like protein